MAEPTVSLLLSFSSRVEDFRTGNRLFYPSTSILFMAFLGILCGAREWEDVVEVGESCEDLLKDWLKDDFVGVPSHDTFNRFFKLVSPESMEQAFRETMRRIRGEWEEGTPKEVVAVDGKYLNGVKGGPALNMVSAYATALGISLGQEEADRKTNEPEALRRLVPELNLKGCVVTADALYCDKEVAKAVIEAKGDYLLTVKANQKHLYESIQEGICVENIRDKAHFITHAEETVRGHGRIERRICHSCSHLGWLPRLGEGWEGIKSFGTVTCERTVLATGKTSTETRCFISSTEKDAEEQMRWVREHWSIENGLHWHLDVTFGEDNSRMDRNQSKNISLLRKLAMPVLKSFEYKKHTSMKRKMTAASIKPEVRKKLILHAVDFYAKS